MEKNRELERQCDILERELSDAKLQLSQLRSGRVSNPRFNQVRPKLMPHLSFSCMLCILSSKCTWHHILLSYAYICSHGIVQLSQENTTLKKQLVEREKLISKLNETQQMLQHQLAAYKEDSRGEKRDREQVAKKSSDLESQMQKVRVSVDVYTAW